MKKLAIQPHRIWVLPISALIIAGLCAYRLTQTHESSPLTGQRPELRRPVPLFELYDQQSTLVKFARYVGRHEILVLFLSSEADASDDPLFRFFVERSEQLRSQNVVPVAINGKLPQENREATRRMGEVPFPILSDLNFEVHRQWGRFDTHREQPLSGLFHVDRAGRVAWEERTPHPISEPARFLQERFGR